MDKYAVFGNPIKHSKSPIVHQLFAKQFGHHIVYDRIEVKDESKLAAFNEFFLDGVGANVTAPLKEFAMSYADELTEIARSAGAVNTLIKKDGRLIGDNTDGVGLVADLKNHGCTLKNKSVLLIGAGGASKGVLPVLLSEQPHHIHICNRTPEKAINMIGENSNVSASGIGDIPDNAFDIVINSTSASISGALPAICETKFKHTQFVYDMCYSAGITVFNQWLNRVSDAKTIDGLGMLVEQAAQSYYLWHGVKPDTAPVIEALKEILRHESTNPV